MVGEKLEAFLLSVSQVSTSEDQVVTAVNCMHDIEHHVPNTKNNESPEVVSEIIKNCQKKCAQYLRAPFADTVRSVIAGARKKLATKAALDSEASYQHSQRHLNILIELLGTWSNIVAQSCEYNFSRSLTRQLLSPLYTRIVEASMECFKAFKRDKELDQWSSRLLDEGSECNVGSLDALVAQVAAFRSMVHQHYTFHYSSFNAYRTGDVGNSALDSAVTASSSSSAGAGGGGGSAILESMLIVTHEELLQWRELDAQYVTLEFGFLQRATQQALQELSLIPIETGVFIPQCVEDMFFIFGKVCERALGTGSESNVFSVGNRIVELIRYTAPEEFERHTILYRMVCSKAFYRKCVSHKQASGRALQHLLKGPTQSNHSGKLSRALSSASMYSTPSKLPVSSNAGTAAPPSGTGAGGGFVTPGKALAAAVSQTALGSLLLGTASASNSTSASNGATGSAEAEESNSTYFSASLPASPALGLAGALLSDAASASLTGVNWWLADQLSPYLSGAEPGEATNSGAGGGAGIAQASRSASMGGIAMQGTPPAGSPASPNLNSSTIQNCSTPNGRPTAPSSLRPPHGASAKSSPPPSASGKFSTAAAAASAAPSSQGSALSLDELLLNALVGDEDSDCEDAYYGSAGNSGVVSIADSSQCADSYLFGAFVEAQHGRLVLREQDWVVQINTLCTIGTSIGNLQGLVAKGRGAARIYEGVQKPGRPSNNSPIDILIQELSGCQGLYTTLLDREAQQLAVWTFLSQIQYPLHKFCSLRFEISGQEMEDRAAEGVLQGIARRCLGITAVERYQEQQQQQEGKHPGGSAKAGGSGGQPGSAPSSQSGAQQGQSDQSADQDQGKDADSREGEARLLREAERAKHGAFLFGCDSHLSQGAYVVVLRELCTLLASYLTDQLLLRAKFSEWGALLLYQEVIGLTQYVEALVDHLDPVHIQTVKRTFAALNLALKILTLDAPGDIRRYTLSQALLSEAQVRAVLARRVEFSSEAVAKVKLTMVEAPPLS